MADADEVLDGAVDGAEEGKREYQMSGQFMNCPYGKSRLSLPFCISPAL
ncbi:MAG: hypothetical protein V7L04_18395 [Nostoc sp.]